MLGTLYLIPNTLGPAATGNEEILPSVIPEEVQQLTARLDYFIAENAKTTRAFLKMVSARHSLAKPLQEIRIGELNVNTSAAALPALLAPLHEGRNAGLISEAGVPAVADPGANLGFARADAGAAGNLQLEKPFNHWWTGALAFLFPSSCREPQESSGDRIFAASSTACAREIADPLGWGIDSPQRVG